MLLTRRTMMGSTFAGALLAPQMAFAAGEAKFVAASISLQDNRIWVAVSLEKRKPELFIIDTGAMSNILSKKWAREQKFEIGHTSRNRGIGGPEQSEILNIDDVLIGGAFRQDYAEFKTSQSLDNGEFKGLLGCKFLTEFDCDLDFVKSEWRIYPQGRSDRAGLYQIPDSYRPRAGSFELEVDAQVGGVSGRFGLDTGAPGTMLIDGPTAAKMNLWDSGAPYAPTQSRGFGPDSVPCRLYRADRMKIHKFVFEKPLVKLMKPGNRLANLYDTDGLIGLKGLRHFLISTDRKNKTLWLAPNGMNFADRDEGYPLSGIWLKRDKDQIVIDDVGIGSPGAAAGLKAGDIMVGKSWDMLLSEVSGPAGRQIALEYEREGRRSRAEFTLQPYL